MLKKKLILVLFVFSCLHLSAQKTPHEFSIYGGGGFSFFAYSPPLLRNVSSGGFSGDAGVGFTGFVSPQVGFHIGAGFGMYNVKAKIGNLKAITPGLIDEANYNYLFDLHTTLSGYTETHKAIFMSVPVMLQFQTKQKQEWIWKRSEMKGFYAIGGVKVNLLLKNEYEAQFATLTNLAYYPELDNWHGTQTFAGLGVFDGSSAGGDLKLGVHVVFAFESGMKWRIGKNLFLYTGAFFDCGLNDPTKDSREPLSDYTYAKYLTYINPLTDLNDLKGFTLLKFSDKINLMTAGIKLRLAFFKIPEREPCPYRKK